MDNKYLKITKNIATGALLAALATTSVWTINKAIEEKRLEYYDVGEAIVWSSRYDLRDNTFQPILNENDITYCNFDIGLKHFIEQKDNKKIIGVSYIIDELIKQNVDYAIIKNEFYTQNGENLVKVTVEYTYPATKTECEDGTIKYSAPNGGTLIGDKAIIQKSIYILEQDEMVLPVGCQLISIDEIIPTKPYSELQNKNIYSEHTDEGYTYKLK